MKTVVIARRTVRRIRNHYLWVFADEVARKPDRAYPGEVVAVQGEAGEGLGVAFFHPGARVALRLLDAENRMPDGGFWRGRLTAALARRRGLWAETNAMRLVYAEGDRLPGLVVDSFAGHLVLQVRNAGMEGLKPLFVELLKELLDPVSIVERSDVAARDEEGLPRTAGILYGDAPDKVEVFEGAARFRVDILHGQKTGFFTDQRTARRHFRDLVRPGGRVLDAFCYTGGFGIPAALAGGVVTAVDKDADALALASENAVLNGVADRFQPIEADLFAWLDARAGAGDRFDLVSLDPPALIKHKNQQGKGRGLLTDLIRPSLRLLEPGGKLHLSTCAYHLSGSLVQEALRMAAADVGRRLVVVGETFQAPDHPWCLQMPETLYLRGVTVEVE